MSFGRTDWGGVRRLSRNLNSAAKANGCNDRRSSVREEVLMEM